MNKNLTTTVFVFPLFLVAIAAVAGCDDGGLHRVVVSGQATYQGQPIERGQIKFFPNANTSAPMSGAHIIDGKFSASYKGGVPVGTYKVEIEAYRTKSSGVHEVEGGGSDKEQYLPAKYNRQTELTLTVVEGPSVTHDFHLD